MTENRISDHRSLGGKVRFIDRALQKRAGRNDVAGSGNSCEHSGEETKREN